MSRVTSSAAQPASPPAEAWPPLPLEPWRDTFATLHLWTQMVGKTRLALSPMENHWWQVALYVTARGFTTSPMPAGSRTVEVELDFLDDLLLARTSDGVAATIPLAPRPVAEFHREYLELLRSLSIPARIRPMPSEIPGALPFDQDRVHDAYDAEAARRCWRALVQADRVFKVFRGSWLGKCSPVHFWWGSFDLACTRFSGRQAPPHPGGIPNLPDRVTREAYSHECISAGWWPGNPDAPVKEAVFYAYAYPEPAGYPEANVNLPEARYDSVMREWLLPYEVVRRSADPDRMLLQFLRGTYETAATLGGWNRAALERAPSPTPAP